MTALQEIVKNARAISERSTCRLHVGNVRYRIAVIARRVSVYHGASRRVALRADCSLAKTRRIDVSIAAASSAPRFGAASAEQLARDCQRLLIVIRLERRGPIQSLQRKRVSGNIARARTTSASSCNRYEIRIKTIESRNDRFESTCYRLT